MPTVTEENYLKALLALADEQGKVTISDLSRSIGVSNPSANSMVKKLAERGLVNYQKYKPLNLTPAGHKTAALIVRKHRLTEMFLVEQMGFGWEEVHAIAEQIEHVKSPNFFLRMDELMGHPTVDPHGSPIPDANGHFTTSTDRRRLSDCQADEQVTIMGLAHDSNDFLHFLNDRGLRLKTRLTILQKERFDGSMTVAYAGHDSVTFSKTVTDRLLVS